MMIDDDMEDQWIIREALDALKTGDVTAFMSGGEAALVQLDDDYTSRHCVPDLIVLDLNMPRMSGTETLGRLKADDRFSGIPVIIYSTSINPYERHKCMELGAHSYVTKPISIEESVKTAETFLSFCS